MTDTLDREPTWLPKKLVLALHAETLHRFGGSSGVRDEGRLESALDRPRNQYAYGEPSVFDLAAAYAYGIVRNHPFVDGNKRTGLLAARAFLFQHGYRLDPEEPETVRVMRQIAAGERSETALAEWLEKNADSH
jgi:death-on-curing protein